MAEGPKQLLSLRIRWYAKCLPYSYVPLFIPVFSPHVMMYSSKLARLDVMSKSDPMCVVYMFKNGAFKEIGKEYPRMKWLRIPFFADPREPQL